MTLNGILDIPQVKINLNSDMSFTPQMLDVPSHITHVVHHTCTQVHKGKSHTYDELDQHNTRENVLH